MVAQSGDEPSQSQQKRFTYSDLAPTLTTQSLLTHLWTIWRYGCRRTGICGSVIDFSLVSVWMDMRVSQEPTEIIGATSYQLRHIDGA